MSLVGERQAVASVLAPLSAHLPVPWWTVSVLVVALVATAAWHVATVRRFVAQRRQLAAARESLAEMSWRLQYAVRTAAIGIFELDTTSGRIAVDGDMRRHFGLAGDQHALDWAAWRAAVHENDRPAFDGALDEAIDGSGELDERFRVRCSDGELRHLRMIAHRADPPREGCIIGVVLDVSADVASEEARKRLDEELHLGRKLEAIGQLAGGIAHDFNNLLTIIITNLTLLQRHEADPQALVFAQDAAKAAQRGSDLVRRLLTFARQESLEPVETDLNSVIRDMGDLLMSTIDRSIRIETQLCHGRLPIIVDPVQLETTIVNLAVNAQDAMPKGGLLHISTSTVKYWFTDAIGSSKTDEIVRLTVRDTGVGMPVETLQRAFDPFFTTKPIEKGTGLGLSIVYGFIKQSGGEINIQSAAGVGTEVSILFPRASSGARALPPSAAEICAYA
ncbi:MAG: PAS domain-containing protein [Alphaproteobacteria bacterium]|nr:PAS domain-containing protein [Alphaproteobacteria bacterium]